MIVAAGWWSLGGEFSLKSLYGTFMISVFTDFLNEIVRFRITLEHTLLAPVFGGVLLGAGLGLIIKVGGATSGSAGARSTPAEADVRRSPTAKSDSRRSPTDAARSRLTEWRRSALRVSRNEARRSSARQRAWNALGARAWYC